MKIKTIARLTATPCGCGGTLAPARRHEATGTVDVLCCFDCGKEDPPLYGRRAVPIAHYCRYCGERFEPDDSRQRYCSDDHARRADAITLDRRTSGQRIRRRA